MRKARIIEAKPLPGTKWEKPFCLQVDGFNGWQVVGHYSHEWKARRKAEREGWEVIETKRTTLKFVLYR